LAWLTPLNNWLSAYSLRGNQPSCRALGHHPGSAWYTEVLDEQWLPLKNQKDEVIGINVVVEEVTERKQAEEALRKAYDELEKRVQERTSELAETLKGCGLRT